MKRKTALILILLICAAMLALQSCGGKSGSDEVKGEDFEWPDSEIGEMLPDTDSKAANLNFSDQAIYVDMFMTNDQFKEYVEKCKEKGFTENVSVSENDSSARYSAENESGYSLSLTLYKDDEECHLSLTAPADAQDDEEEKEDDDSEKSEKKKKEKKKKKNDSTGGVDPDFKAAMDEYEKFFDQYVEVLKNYEKDPASYLTEYTQMLTQYAETMEKLDEIDSDSLSAADSAYYLEVMARINSKLAEVAS